MSGNNIGCLLVFMIPFVLVGVGFTLAIPIRFYVQANGTPITAVVDGTHLSRGSKGGITYHVDFHYLLNGRSIADHQQVSKIQYDRARIGQRVAGRAMMLLKWPVCVTQIGSVAGMMAGFTVFWDAFLVLFISLMVVPLLREKRLISQGTPAAGTITGHHLIRGKSTAYSITYRYHISDGTEINGRKMVTRTLYNSAVIGSAVTVLYDPAKPKRSVPYEFSNYEVVPLVG
jgi:hypothetical protein